MKTLRTKTIKALANFIAEVNIETRRAEQAKNRLEMKGVYDFFRTATELKTEELTEQIKQNSNLR